MMAEKLCLHCNEKFDGKTSAAYCSIHCALWSRVLQLGVSDCWPWTGSKAFCGYGDFRWSGKRYRTNRAVLFCTTGEDHANLDALHSCDNPSCCNPAHLRWGTHKENMHDRWSRGRANMPKGEHHYRARLTGAQVDEIKQLLGKYRQVDIAAQFGVPRSCIADISSGRSWRK